MNAIEAFMGDGANAARAIIISPSSAFSTRHNTVGIGAVVLRRDGKDYTPNKLSWVRWVDRNGVPHEDAEQNFSILERDNIGFDGVQLSTSRMFPNEAVEPLATVVDWDVVRIRSAARGEDYLCKVLRGTPDNDWSIECDFVPVSGDSGSIVTKDGVFVGLVSAKSDNGCLISVPPMLANVPGQEFHEGTPDPIPDPILVPTNPTSPYTPPPGSTPEFKAGVAWERNRAFTAAQKRLIEERNEALAAI